MVNGNAINKGRRISANQARRLKRVKRPRTIPKSIAKQIVNSHQLKSIRSNPKANITLSGKKKRRLEKMIRRREKEQNAMQVETTGNKDASPNKRCNAIFRN